MFRSIAGTVSLGLLLGGVALQESQALSVFEYLHGKLQGIRGQVKEVCKAVVTASFGREAASSIQEPPFVRPLEITGESCPSISGHSKALVQKTVSKLVSSMEQLRGIEKLPFGRGPAEMIAFSCSYLQRYTEALNERLTCLKLQETIGLEDLSFIELHLKSILLDVGYMEYVRDYVEQGRSLANFDQTQAYIHVGRSLSFPFTVIVPEESSEDSFDEGFFAALQGGE